MVRAIREVCQVGRYPGPVEVHTFFRFARLCEPDQTMPWPTREGGEFGHGDEDKLRRNALDALTQSGLILDDSLVVGGRPHKRWCLDGEQPGVWIVVRPDPKLEELLEFERSLGCS